MLRRSYNVVSANAFIFIFALFNFAENWRDLCDQGFQQFWDDASRGNSKERIWCAFKVASWEYCQDFCNRSWGNYAQLEPSLRDNSSSCELLMGTWVIYLYVKRVRIVFAYAIALMSNTLDFFRSLNKWCKFGAKFSIANKNTKWEKLFAIAEITLGKIFYSIMFSRVFLQDWTTYVAI